MLNQEKQNSEWDGVDRRLVPSGGKVTLDEAWAYIQDLNDRVNRLEHRYGNVSSAFVKNDIDKPDFDGHRRAHADMIKQAEAMEGLKQEGAKSIMKAVIGFLAGVFSLGIVEWFRIGSGK